MRWPLESAFNKNRVKLFFVLFWLLGIKVENFERIALDVTGAVICLAAGVLHVANTTQHKTAQNRAKPRHTRRRKRGRLWHLVFGVSHLSSRD
jgi:hypothetical protein